MKSRIAAISESGIDPIKTTFVREVTAIYRGARKAVDQITQPRHAATLIQKVLPDNSREHFVALYLDGASKVIAFSVVATGTANSCPVHPREIFQRAILAGAVSLIIGHNHPSGALTPSEEDRKLTRRLKEIGELLGIKLLDHVIVGESAFHAFSESGEF